MRAIGTMILVAYAVGVPIVFGVAGWQWRHTPEAAILGVVLGLFVVFMGAWTAAQR